MKFFFTLLAFLVTGCALKAQINYDSLTISRFLIQDDMYDADWVDTLKGGRYPHYIADERTVWIKPAVVAKVLPPVISLLNQIRTNGTADVAKCFIPRHSINYYKEGKIVKFLLICFECDGLHFSDDPPKNFMNDIKKREKQLQQLKEIFKDLL